MVLSVLRVLISAPPFVNNMKKFESIISDAGIKPIWLQSDQAASEDEIISVISDVDAWILGDDLCTAKILECGSNGNLKAVVKWGIGTDNIDFEAIEKFSVVKTLQSISEANVVVLLLDAQQDISEQDAHIAGFVLESGRALVVGVNKWDGLTSDRRDEIKMDIDRKLSFLSFAKFHYISALKSTGVTLLMKSVDAAYAAAMAKLPTPQLTRALQEAVDHQQPRRKGSIRPKLRYAHQGGQNPPIIVIHGNALDAIDANYKRFLEKHFRDTFALVGTPLRIELRSGKNPFSKEG
jgi:hypothetical protein